MVGLSIILLIYERTHDAKLSGLAVAAYTLPSILSGPLLGAWLDRTRRPLLALAGNQFVLAAMVVGLIWAVGRAPAFAVLGFAFVAGITLPMTSGGFTSLVPRLVSASDLPKATSTDALLFNVAAIGGPALAAVLAPLFGATSAMVAIVVLALLGGLCTCFLRLPPHTPAGHGSLVVAMGQGLRHLVTTAPLRGATLASVLSYGSIGALAIALPKHVESLGVDDGYTGVVWALIEVGCIGSVLALRPHLHRWRPERTVFAAVALYGLALATWPLATSFAVLLALALLSGVAEGPTLTAIITARQRYTPAALLGQVSTTGASLKIGGFALGAALGGTLITTPTTVILAVAATQLAAALLGLLATRTRSEQPPNQAYGEPPTPKKTVGPTRQA